MAILTQLHDVIIAMGAVAFLGWEVNTSFIAAVLTVVGYSINDTIVVYDRIREARAREPKLSPADLANPGNPAEPAALHQHQRHHPCRGGRSPDLGRRDPQGLRHTLLVGIVVGTYSSLCVASPLWVSWTQWLSGRSGRARQARAS